MSGVDLYNTKQRLLKGDSFMWRGVKWRFEEWKLNGPRGGIMGEVPDSPPARGYDAGYYLIDVGLMGVDRLTVDGEVPKEEVSITTFFEWFVSIFSVRTEYMRGDILFSEIKFV